MTEQFKLQQLINKLVIWRDGVNIENIKTCVEMPSGKYLAIREVGIISKNGVCSIVIRTIEPDKGTCIAVLNDQ